jgi:transposase-like protein
MTEAIDLCELVERFGDDQQCRNYLEHLRWPKGILCPKCGGEKISSILKRDQHNCDNESCGYQFSVTAGTIFHDTHLALTKWFLAVFLICQSRKGMSANQLKRMLRINYRTAWYLCHRIRRAMAQDVPLEKMDGTVEVDETYVGGKKIGSGVYAGKKAKEAVIGIRQRGGDLRFFHAEDAKSGTLAKYIQENVSGDVDVLVADKFAAYPWAMKKAGVPAEKHRTIEHKERVYVRGDIHTNTVESAFSLLKRGIMGTWHKISAKHLPAYLAEMEFRFNRRHSKTLFLDTLRHMVTADPLTFENLTA